MKFVLYVATGVEIPEGMDNLVDPQKESGEDFERRILEVLKQIRREKLRHKEEEGNKTKENGLSRREDETKTDEKGDEGEQTKQNPQHGVMVKQINELSDKKLN